MADKRLIDANALPNYRVKIVHAFGIVEGNVVFPDDIANAPTVDAVEVVHAMWIKELRGIVRCSYCDRGYRITNGGANVLKFFYCPNCGAKMDLKEATNEENPNPV